ncbi:MAG: NAD(P)H-hydrate epimerase, partial [Leuconostoc gelidum]
KIGLTQRVGGYLSGNVIVKDIGLLTPPDFSFSDTADKHSATDV